MAPTTNLSAIFNSIPQSYPVLNETIIHGASTIDLDTSPLHGGLLTKTLYLSIDPYQRSLMRAPDEQKYASAFELGKP